LSATKEHPVTVFVSHSRRDKELPEFDLLTSDLALMRASYWIDEQLGGGQQWWDEILTQIRASSVVLVVLTPRSLKSDACRREWSYARSLGRPLLPVRLADIAQWQIPDYVAESQLLDYLQRASSDAGVATAMKLRDAIERFEQSARPLPDPLPDPPGMPLAVLGELQPVLDKKDLTFAEQERFLNDLRGHLDVEDDERTHLVGALKQFRGRPDIAVRIREELDQIIERLVSEGPVPDPPVDPGVPANGNGVPHGQANGSGNGTPQPTTTRSAHFSVRGVDLQQLAVNLTDWYASQSLQAQWSREGRRYVVQCREQRAWARWVGAGAALTVVLSATADELTVEIGGAKWADKLAATGVGAFIFWPAAVTAAVGSYRQAVLPNKTLEHIERTLPLVAGRR
jgi:hypothetical protein